GHVRLHRVGNRNVGTGRRRVQLRPGVDRAVDRKRVVGAERRVVIRFRSMGCNVVLSDGRAEAPIRELFDERDKRFSRFVENSELKSVNARPLGVSIVSDAFAAMLDLALRAARATDGLVTPAVGAAVEAAGYDDDFHWLAADGPPSPSVAVPDLDALALRGRVLLRVIPVVLDLNGVVKGKTVDDALALQGGGWVSAGGDIATTTPVEVRLPGGASILLREGGLATSSVDVR